MVFHEFIVITALLFRNNGKKGDLDEKDFCHCFGNFFSQVAFLKLVDHSSIQISFSITTGHVDYSILKDDYFTVDYFTDVDQHAN